MSHRLLRAAGAGILVLALAACGSRGHVPVRPSPAELSPGSPLLVPTLSGTDAWVRHYLSVGEPEKALALLERGSGLRPRDLLVRRLLEGVVLHEAGRFEESNRAFDRVEREIDRRYAKSVRRGAGALLVSDRALAYLPSRTERAMVPYYRMLNYLAMGEDEGALVEARKAEALLAESEGGCHAAAFLHHLSGLVFDAGAERNDALVSLRLAERALAACPDRREELAPYLAADLHRAASALGVEEVADSVVARYALTPVPADSLSASVLVLVEQGFVAHLSQEELELPIYPLDADGERRGEDDFLRQVTERAEEHLSGGPSRPTPRADPAPTLRGRPGAENAAAAVSASAPVARLEAARSTEPAPRSSGAWGGAVRSSGGVDGRTVAAVHRRAGIEAEPDGDARPIAGTGAASHPSDTGPLVQRQHPASDPGGDGDPYFLKLAWPVYHRDPPPAHRVRLRVNGEVAAAPDVADLSAGVIADLERERPILLARLAARAATKYAVTRELRETAEEKGGEGVGSLVGLVTNLVGNAVERADTRGWSVLPDRVSLAHLRLTPGEHHVQLEVVDADGTILRISDLGWVRVGSGERVFLRHRLWQETQLVTGGS